MEDDAKCPESLQMYVYLVFIALNNLYLSRLMTNIYSYYYILAEDGIQEMVFDVMALPTGK